MAFKGRKERGLRNMHVHFKSSDLELKTGSNVSRIIPGWFRHYFEWAGFMQRAPCLEYLLQYGDLMLLSNVETCDLDSEKSNSLLWHSFTSSVPNFIFHKR